MLQVWIGGIHNGIYGIQNYGTRTNRRKYSSSTL